MLLNEYNPDTQTRLLLNLKGDSQEAQLDLVVWITGINEDTEAKREDVHILDDEYKLSQSMKNMPNVGYLTVQVVQAQGLGSSKLQGDTDSVNVSLCISFIVLEESQDSTSDPNDPE